MIDKECFGAGIIKTGDLTKIQGFWLTDKRVKEICKKHRREPENSVKTPVLSEETKKNELNWREIARGM